MPSIINPNIEHQFLSRGSIVLMVACISMAQVGMQILRPYHSKQSLTLSIIDFHGGDNRVILTHMHDIARPLVFFFYYMEQLFRIRMMIQAVHLCKLTSTNRT